MERRRKTRERKKEMEKERRINIMACAMMNLERWVYLGGIIYCDWTGKEKNLTALYTFIHLFDYLFGMRDSLHIMFTKIACCRS
jgi:hypothetical protein